MKKYIYIFLSIILVLTFCLNPLVIANDQITIFIDPGHGGVDKGAMVGGILESDLNLSVSLKLKEILEEQGFSVLLTRTGDYDLSTDPDHRKKTDAVNRVKLINESDANLFISIHMNTFLNSKYTGAQVFYNRNYKDNYVLAKSLEESFQTYLNSKRTASSIKDIYIIDHVKKTGVLVECGFMTNKDELKMLLTSEYQTQVAYSVYFGIRSFLNT